MSNRFYAAVLAVICAVFIFPGCCCAERVLLVTTEQCDTPWLSSSQDGMYVAADLVGAGVPFDIRTYGRFVAADLSPYDVIILNGPTSPAPVDDVAQKCQEAVAAGKRVFINGSQPYQYFSASGSLIDEDFYAAQLFGVSKSAKLSVTGAAQIPDWLQKDAAITALGVNNKYVQTYDAVSSMPVEIRLGGRIVGLVGPTGGLIDGGTSYALGLIDYGKLVGYFRHGSGLIVGFANDRVEGKPIVSWEVHCHTPGVLAGVYPVLALSSAYEIPLDILMVYNQINQTAVAEWNSVTSPLIAKGSHSRTHPLNWPGVPDVLYESTQASADQRVLIPDTTNYFNFSGNMNPTAAQMDQIYNSGLLFGGSGQSWRTCITPDGGSIPIQMLPMNRWWLHELAKCETTPAWLAHTLMSDATSVSQHIDFDQNAISQLAQNTKYGMYTYGYIHDTYMNPTMPKYGGDETIDVEIEKAGHWFRDQNVHFMFAHDLIARLQDYMAGQIGYTANPDGTITVTVTRPGALANEIKIGIKDNQAPYAAGPSVISQRLTGQGLYVRLQPEVTSTIQVGWSAYPPVPPVIVNVVSFVSNASEVRWMEPQGSLGIAEYRFAVGSQPGAADLEDWTSTGSATSAVLSQARLAHGQGCYVAVKSRDSLGHWSDPGVSPRLIADLTPPPRSPFITDSGSQQSDMGSLYASWVSSDPESGIGGYQYALGSSPGFCDVTDWTFTTETEARPTGLNLSAGTVYYMSVRARNGANLWGPVGSSDGILVLPRPVGIGVAKRCVDGIEVELEPAVVTAAYDGGFYAESPYRSSGVRVISSVPVDEGALVEVGGTMGRVDGERVVSASSVEVLGSGSVKPLYLVNRALGGGGDTLMSGPSNGAGLSNIGLLVRTFGRVTEIGPDYVCISDGSITDMTNGSADVKVAVTPPPSLRVGSAVFAVGISALEPMDSGYRRLIRTRRADDVLIVVR